MQTITKEELEQAIKKAKAGTAPGPSQVSIDMIKGLTSSARGQLLHFYNNCMKEKRLPDNINKALMRLLPKTDKGLANLNAVRPIALMENIMKVYEHIIIGRETKVIMDNQLIEMEQFGAVPKAGVAGPLRVLAELIDDARISGQEIHIMVADLAKAFDTCEYWSQALSWKCLGMPEDMIDILVNMDSGDPAGKGATTQVVLGSGRTTEPFKHGRGVRQGSVGGPIKWVVFVNFWIKWMKKKMKGEGYTMSAANKTRTVKEMWSQPNTEKGETPPKGKLRGPLTWGNKSLLRALTGTRESRGGT